MIGELSQRDRRRAAALLRELADLFEPAQALASPGDVELAAALFPAWWAVHGAGVVTVADLYAAPEGTALADLMRRTVERATNRESAAKVLGHALRRLAESSHDATGYRLTCPGRDGGRACWVLHPL